MGGEGGGGGGGEVVDHEWVCVCVCERVCMMKDNEWKGMKEDERRIKGGDARRGVTVNKG